MLKRTVIRQQSHMTERTMLGSYIRSLVDQRSISTNQISQYTATDRSTIYQIYSGTRLPTIAFLKALIAPLRLTTDEANRLFCLYHEIRDGKWLTARNDAMFRLIACIWDAQIDVPFASFCTPLAENIESREGMYALSGEQTMNASILRMLHQAQLGKDSSGITLFVTQENMKRIKNLLLIYAEELNRTAERQILLKQLIVVDPAVPENEDADVNQYMNPFFTVAALYSQACFNYRAKLVYSQPPSTFFAQMVYTNYILVENACLYLSSDGKRGIYLQDAQVAEQQRLLFEEAAAQALDMMVPSNDILQTLQGYICQLVEYVGAQVRLSSSPPLFYTYTRELVEKYVPKAMPRREEFVSLVMQYYVNRVTFDQHDMLFFTLDGLERFADTGILDDLPPAIIGIIDREDRYIMLKRCYDMMMSGKLQLYILNDRFPKLTPYFTLYSDTVRLWITDQRFFGGYDTLSITDHLTVQWFRDFCTSLPASEFIYSDSEAQAQWERILNKLK